MHSVMVICGGLVLLALFLLIGKFMHKLSLAARIFIPVWFVAALINLGIGVSHGYSVLVELPFFVAVFSIPAVIAWAVYNKYR